ncbi:MAG: DUF1343 domain-containing protein [Bacteroidia bacterium]|nr:DUF1343 domain-containing protein [Bacteroidia bacterium]
MKNLRFELPYRSFRVLCAAVFMLSMVSCKAQIPAGAMKTGADQTEKWLPVLKGKQVALAANPTSMIGKVHLVDSMLRLGIRFRAVFAPEHGFRGNAEAGELVEGGVDKESGVKVISLYGDHKKPLPSDLEGIDIIVFDIQDVGVRFYTYISTLQYMMEAAAATRKPLLILDRPNPHGNYTDGPVLDTAYRSFVGMQSVPVIHGMTVGEYATMLNGERWLEGGLPCDLSVVRMLNWKHSDDYQLPVAPSPNLPNTASIRLYPSLCFFEGTAVSLGRGTDLPFQCYGFPGNPGGTYAFTPQSIKGKSVRPMYEGQECRGERLDKEAFRFDRLQLKWLLKAYKNFPEKDKFFNPFFDKLAGGTSLREQIIAGWDEERIRSSWQSGLESFRSIRSKYLLYP